jgi:hypothetical protein
MFFSISNYIDKKEQEKQLNHPPSIIFINLTKKGKKR